MSLHASVYCDCFERGRLRNAPRPEWKVYVDNVSGARFEGTKDLDEQIAFDQWDYDACEHENGWLVLHRLGNIAEIRTLRNLLEPLRKHLPVLLDKVIHNGVHCGDSLFMPDVEQLAVELANVEDVHDADPWKERLLREFETQLRELTGHALAVRKPIAF